MMLWVTLLLGITSGSKAGGTPEKKPDAFVRYQIITTQIYNDAIAGSGVEDAVQITVIDLDNGGQPVAGVTVNITIDNNVVSSNPVTDAFGNVIFKLSGGQVGSAQVHIKVPGTSTDFIFNYIAGPPASNPGNGGPGGGGNPNLSYFIVTKDNSVADGTDQDIVQVYLTNNFGAYYPVGTRVTLTVTSSTVNPTDAKLNLTTTQTVTVPLGPNGLINIPITDLTIGNVTLQVTLPDYGNVVIGGAGFTQTVHFISGPPDPAKSYIVVTQDNQTADGVAKDIVTAYLYDANGNPTTGTVTFTMPGGGSATLGTTSSSGNTVSATFTDLSIEGVQVAASVAAGPLHDQANPGNNFVTIHFVAGPPDPSKSYVVVTQDNQPAGGGTDIVTAYLYDAQGRPTTGTVTFTMPSGGSATLGTTSGSGNTVSATFTDPTIEGVQVVASVTAGPLPDQANPANNFVTIHFVAGPPDPSKSYIVVTQDNAIANSGQTDIVTAYLFDANGNPTTGSVTFTVGGTAIMVGSPVVSGNTVTVTYKDSKVEGVQVVATTAAGPLPDQNNPGNNFATIHFVTSTAVPGDPSGGGTGGTPPGNGGVPPGGGNGGGTGGPGTNPGGGNGNNGGPGDNSGFTLLFVKQDYRLGDGKEQDSVIAYVTDAYKNPVKGEHIKFFIQTSPDQGTATATASFTIDPNDVVTDDQGMARIALTSTKPGTVFVSAILLSQNVLIDGSYQIVTFTDKPDVNNPETRLIVVVYEAIADGVQQTVVKAHVVSLDGQIMVGQDVTFKVDSGTAQIVGSATVQTDANGDAIIYLTSTKPGTAAITATVGGEQIIYGSPARVKFAPINIYVPKVFTPNNDGNNDILKPILVGIQKFMYWSIYNRWGNLIYTSQDPNQGWTGFWKGVAQPVETYLWIAEGVDISGKHIVAKGIFSLVR